MNGIYKKLKKSYVKNSPELLALLKRSYPDFVFKSDLQSLKDEIPVFTLHSVNPGVFEEQLYFLSSNNYQTLIADEFYEYLTGSKPFPERTILLTFDDGWKNLYTVVYPLLKKYKMRAVCFLIPGLINSNEGGKITPNNNSEKPVPDSDTFCSWEEIKEMHESKIIDFQSHSMYHDLVFTSSHIEDFFSPGYDDYPMNLNIPLFKENGADNILRNAKLGAPIYSNNSRFFGKNRYFDDESLRDACANYVLSNGGTEIFKRSNWRKDLFNIAQNHREKYSNSGYFESNEQLRENLFFEFHESKTVIEKKLEGKKVNHFCYPWWIGSAFASQISRDAGYLTNFWGIVPGRKTNKKGDDPFRIARLVTEDFIFRLPGKGRKSLLKVLQNKFYQNQQKLRKKLFSN